MIKFITDDKCLRSRSCELLSEIPAVTGLDIDVELSKGGEGLSVWAEDGKWHIEYANYSALWRAVTLLAQRAANGETERITETPAFETLGAMVDMSGNAAMKPTAIKRFCRILAAEGYNALLLKTVKGTDVKADFSALCGRYTEKEINELDEYARGFGIELVPYVQLSELPSFASVEDFCETMDGVLSAYSQGLSSRKICFGFDRPQLPGCEKYPEPTGNFDKALLADCMQCLSELCNKYGYLATMGGAILGELGGADESFTYAVSECTSVNRDTYRSLLDGLAEKTEKVGFVGGDNGWYGAVPLSWLSHTVACNTLPVLLEKSPKEVYVAMWRDDTAACSYFATLPVLFAYGETCWARTDYTEHLSERMLSVCGVDFYDMVPLEDIPAIRCRLNTGRIIVTPGRYMLYDKVVGGAFDHHSTGGVAHLKNITVWMAERIERAGEFAYVFETQVAFSNLLASKADINETLRRAFRKKLPEMVQKVYDENFDKALAAVDEFVTVLRRQWDRECMDFGMELIEERAELVKSRISEGKPIVGDYLSGKLERFDFFEDPTVPYEGEEELVHDQTALLLSNFETIIKASEK